MSSRYYNHYSALRTMEDLLLTGHTCTNPTNADTPLPAGTVCGGLDGLGHLGYSAQAGLADFGPDVFTAHHYVPAPTSPRGSAGGNTGASGNSGNGSPGSSGQNGKPGDEG